jgi:hypothetical protein
VDTSQNAIYRKDALLPKIKNKNILGKVKTEMISGLTFYTSA